MVVIRLCALSCIEQQIILWSGYSVVQDGNTGSNLSLDISCSLSNGLLKEIKFCRPNGNCSYFAEHSKCENSSEYFIFNFNLGVIFLYKSSYSICNQVLTAITTRDSETHLNNFEQSYGAVKKYLPCPDIFCFCVYLVIEIIQR